MTKELNKEVKTQPNHQLEPIEQGVGYSSDRTLAKFYDASRSTIWKWAREGKLPKPIKLTSGATRWDNKSVKAFAERLYGE